MKYIDISEHQGCIDFEKVKGNVDGVIIRAGYGKNNIDRYFVRNISECNRLGIPCGIYWFSYAYTVDMAKNEAIYCLNAIKKYKVELPVAFDWEYDSKAYADKHGAQVSSSLVTMMVKAFCKTIEEAGYYAMNYTNVDYFNRYMSGTTEFDLWLAYWVNDYTKSKPVKKCGIWQYGSSIVPGIDGAVDSNVANNDYKTIIVKAGLNNLNVKEKTWQEDAMDWAKENGINDGTRADEQATRAEVSKMLKNYHEKFFAKS